MSADLVQGIQVWIPQDQRRRIATVLTLIAPVGS